MFSNFVGDTPLRQERSFSTTQHQASTSMPRAGRLCSIRSSCLPSLRLRRETGCVKTNFLLFSIGAIAVLVIVGLFFANINRKQKPHTVTLTWQSPSPAKGIQVTSYNIYRSTIRGGPYAKIATKITTLKYTDLIVNSGRTYFYVVTAVDQYKRESKYSGQTQATIP